MIRKDCLLKILILVMVLSALIWFGHAIAAEPGKGKFFM